MSQASERRPWTVQHGCVQVIMLISALMSATYYVLALVLPMRSNLPIAAVVVIGAITALLAIALDILKPSMVALTAENCKHRKWFSVLFGGLLAAMLILVSGWAVDGLLLMFRGWAISEPARQTTAYTIKEAALRAADAEIQTIGQTRTARQIEVDMAKVVIDPSVLRRTNYCDAAQITKDESRVACQPLVQLKTEMQQTLRKSDLQMNAETMRRWLVENPKPSSPDLQIELTSKFLGWQESTVALLRWSILGAVIEVSLVVVPALLASRKVTPVFSMDLAPLAGAGAGPTEAGAKRTLAELLEQNQGRVKTTVTQLSVLMGASQTMCRNWRKSWIAAGLITERFDGNYLVVARGPNWYSAAPKLTTLV